MANITKQELDELIADIESSRFYSRNGESLLERDNILAHLKNAQSLYETDSMTEKLHNYCSYIKLIHLLNKINAQSMASYAEAFKDIANVFLKVLDKEKEKEQKDIEDNAITDNVIEDKVNADNDIEITDNPKP